MLPIAMLAALAGAMTLPVPSDRAPLTLDHFPTPAHALVWRNWQLIPAERVAAVIEAQPEDVVRMGRAMGLGDPPTITEDLERRSYISVIRRNWHLLPYAQLTQLLGMTDEQLAFTLREDDFLYIKLGSLKPDCLPIQYAPPTPEVLAREEAIAAGMQVAFPEGAATLREPLFQFVSDLSTPLESPVEPRASRFSPRYCSSYFALFGDPLLEEDVDPYPDAYLDRLVASGVDSVWMHVVLYQLAPYPWDSGLSAQHEARLARLKTLTERAKARGIGIFLYLNEPRAMPVAFFEANPDLKGVVEGDHAAVCTSVPEVRDYLRDSVATICRAVPDLRGFFTITGSENLTSCWSHHRGDGCPRCKERTPAEVIAEVNATFWEGIQAAGSDAELIAWDWGWRDDWAVDTINRLPDGIAHMSVSEWSIPITRGGIENKVGEYSISTIGPGPRATKHWEAARARGLKTVAKIQAGNTWELSAVPYIPAVANVATHAANLRNANVDGIMLGWSLGGYPSPNLEVVAEIAGGEADLSIQEAMTRVAARRYGDTPAPAVVRAWEAASAALSEFPYDGSVVYNAPIQAGPSNLLWSAPTEYRATMVGIPYDDLDRWRGPYPADIFAQQFTKMADGFEAALQTLQAEVGDDASPELQRAYGVFEATALHYRSVAQQARFVTLRSTIKGADALSNAQVDEMEGLIRSERDTAIRLHAIQAGDSRIGYESSNHYFYVPVDLAEKVLNCERLLAEWVPQLRARAEKKPESKLTYDARVSPMPTLPHGPFVRLKDNRILAVDKTDKLYSSDEGQTWARVPLFTPEQKLQVSNERAMLRTKSGAIILVFLNVADYLWKWNKETSLPEPESHLDVWSIRSLDEGETWIDAQVIYDGYSGDIHDLLQARDGTVIAPVQEVLYEDGRHAIRPRYSKDDGKTWHRSNLLDIGGRGHHDGLIEPTLIERRDGRIWMLCRTNLDYFWSAFSDDMGKYWRTLVRSDIPASSAPGQMERLASGRLILVWNRPLPEGATDHPRIGGDRQWSETPAWNFRAELSIAFSDDDGTTWTTPAIIARKPDSWLAYPQVFERAPGELWITTMQGDVRAALFEKDFVE
jgi:hypothetical protein